MTQIVVSGHGQFASGMLSAVNLIIGKSSGVEAIDFVNGPETLKKNLTEIVTRIDDGTGIIIFTDLLGATPFQTSVVVSHEMGIDVRVVGGTNLSMILAAAINKNKTLEETLALSLEEGKQFIDFYRLRKKEQHESKCTEEGI